MVDNYKVMLGRAREIIDHYDRDIETYKALDALWQVVWAMFVEVNSGTLGATPTAIAADDLIGMARKLAEQSTKRNGKKKQEKDPEEDDPALDHHGHRGQYL